MRFTNFYIFIWYHTTAPLPSSPSAGAQCQTQSRWIRYSWPLSSLAFCRWGTRTACCPCLTQIWTSSAQLRQSSVKFIFFSSVKMRTSSAQLGLNQIQMLSNSNLTRTFFLRQKINNSSYLTWIFCVAWLNDEQRFFDKSQRFLLNSFSNMNCAAHAQCGYSAASSYHLHGNMFDVTMRAFPT